jgi:hypothetical protein
VRQARDVNDFGVAWLDAEVRLSTRVISDVTRSARWGRGFDQADADTRVQGVLKPRTEGSVRVRHDSLRATSARAIASTSR